MNIIMVIHCTVLLSEGKKLLSFDSAACIGTAQQSRNIIANDIFADFEMVSLAFYLNE